MTFTSFCTPAYLQLARDRNPPKLLLWYAALMPVANTILKSLQYENSENHVTLTTFPPKKKYTIV